MTLATQNTSWKLDNLLSIALATANLANEHKESVGADARDDFPAIKLPAREQ